MAITTLQLVLRSSFSCIYIYMLFMKVKAPGDDQINSSNNT